MFEAVVIVLGVYQVSRIRSWDSPFLLLIFLPLAALLYTAQENNFYLPQLQPVTELAFVLGYAGILWGLSIPLSLSRRRTAQQGMSYNLILLLGIFPTIISAVLFQFPIFASDVEAAKREFLLPLIGQLYLFLPMLFVIADRNKNGRQRNVALIVNLALGILLVSRFTLFLAVIFWFLTADKSVRRNLLRQGVVLIGAAVVLVQVFLSFFELRSEFDMTVYQWFKESQGIEIWGYELADNLILPYMYLVTPLSNFDYTVEFWSDYQYGLATSGSILRLLQMDALAPSYLVRNEVFNTNMYMSTFYMDFGLFGVFLFSFLLGFGIKYLNCYAEVNGDPFSNTWRIFTGYATLLLFFSNHFSSVGYPVLFPLMFVLARGFLRLFKYDC